MCYLGTHTRTHTHTSTRIHIHNVKYIYTNTHTHIPDLFYRLSLCARIHAHTPAHAHAYTRLLPFGKCDNMGARRGRKRKKKDT